MIGRDKNKAIYLEIGLAESDKRVSRVSVSDQKFYSVSIRRSINETKYLFQAAYTDFLQVPLGKKSCTEN